MLELRQRFRSVWVFFFNDTATTEIYTLSLHDALPIFWSHDCPREEPHSLQNWPSSRSSAVLSRCLGQSRESVASARSEEHTSELQSRQYLVCRLLLEKKQKLSLLRQRPSSRSQRAHTR